MSCNCGTSKSIDELYKHFGVKRKTEGSEKIEFNVKKVLYTICTYAMMAVAVPFLFIYFTLFYIFSKDRSIDIQKIFRLKKYKKIEDYVGVQQVV